MTRSVRTLRRVSQIRVNPQEMTLAQLDVALKRKMVEKMGRKVFLSTEKIEYKKFLGSSFIGG